MENSAIHYRNERRADWPTRLNAIVEERKGWPFVWGENDCCLFAAAVIAEMTGIDVGYRFRGRYCDAAGALRVLRPYGGTIDGVVESFGFQPLAPLNARRGDLVLVESNDVAMPKKFLAVSLGGHAAAPGRTGLIFIPPKGWLKGWRV